MFLSFSQLSLYPENMNNHPYLEEVKPNELGFIGESLVMKKVYSIIHAIGKQPVTVNISGESGTGKELVAKALHKLSQRDGEYVALNCGAFQESLLESELFGITKGAATGVIKRKGKIEASNNGTLFLDEITEMSQKMQVDFLRVIQEKEFCRIGENYSIKIDSRFITAASKSLEESVRSGKFRADLYYRLNVIPITLPPLRERGRDITLLAKYFCGKFSLKYNKNLYLHEETSRAKAVEPSRTDNAR